MTDYLAEGQKINDAVTVLAGKADIEVSALTRIVADQEATIQEAQQTILDQSREITTLKKDLADCRGTNPPVLSTVFGVSAPQNTVGGENLITKGERIFLSPGQKPTSVSSHGMLKNALNRLTADGTLWLSIKDPAGPWFDSLIKSIYQTKPGLRFLATANHEPFDNYNFKNASDWRKWTDLQLAFEAVCADYPKIEMVTIVEAYHVPSRTPGYFEAAWREKQKFGADSYNPGIGSPKRYVPPVEVHGELAEWVKKNKSGQKLYIGETGVGITANTPEAKAGRTKWLIDNRAYMDKNADVAMWWNSGKEGPTGQGCRLTMPELNTWLSGV